jgi:hypothetical protein
MVMDGPVDELSFVQVHNQHLQRTATIKEHPKQKLSAQKHQHANNSPDEQKGIVEGIDNIDNRTIADDDPRQSSIPDILNLEQVLTNESQKKVKIQHRQGGANHADDDPIQQERSSNDDITLERVGTVSHT